MSEADSTKQSSSRVLFVGDIVGSIGRKALKFLLPQIRQEHSVDFVVVNGENIAGGVGITPNTADQLFEMGVDAITLGNHTYRHREIYPYLDSDKAIIRPTNFLNNQPGKGHCIVEHNGVKLGVVSVSGNLYMDAGKPAFTETDAALAKLEGKVDHILVDMHGEATSEKIGLGWYLDGRVTAVVGTHTHVPTADARVLPQGTAYITDVGMTGPRGGVIGVKKEQAIEGMVTKMPVRFETSPVDPWLMGVVVTTVGGTMQASDITQLLIQAPETL